MINLVTGCKDIPQTRQNFGSCEVSDPQLGQNILPPSTILKCLLRHGMIAEALSMMNTAEVVSVQDFADETEGQVRSVHAASRPFTVDEWH